MILSSSTLQPKGCPGNRCQRLNQPPFRKGQPLPLADDEVIQHAHVDQRQGLLEPLGDADVGLTGLRDPGRMVVGQDDRRRVMFQDDPDHFPGVDMGPVDGAPEQKSRVASGLVNTSLFTR